MNSIVKRDVQVFLAAWMRPVRILAMVAIPSFLFGIGVSFAWPITVVSYALIALSAWQASKAKRFRNLRMYRGWLDVVDRHERLRKELNLASKRRIADLTELPLGVSRVAAQLYTSLRKADILAHEIGRSEGPNLGPPSHLPPSDDPQAQELYRLADRHLAEYSRRYANLRASVERTEAQAVVFVTLLDNLRVQLLQHRLGSPGSHLEAQEFLEAVTEAKMQLNAIDKTLDELELTPFPRTVVVVPPEPTAEDERQETGP
ncbi:MAG: hypothetical protein IT207_09410 [Fimbriimonadaceae bacterium]|nr:hypothetical protein [Fimbriimonadaceae bacterium]